MRLVGVGKRYVKYEDAPMLVTRLAGLRTRTRRSSLWAIRNVDFELQRGDVLGVIGRNGSGKSTLLRMLAGVTAPTEGTVMVRGRVAPLISVGVGFHPELTGRENVYVNGTILGLSRQEVDRRFDEVVDFAEIPAFIDTPVKFYSSGMFVRLGFAVAVLAEPDVLLVDEVLAVGDIAFQLKCYDRMQQIRDRGTTIVVVSHNLNAVRLLCPRVMVVHDGAVRFDGAAEEALALYHDLLGPQPDEAATIDEERAAEVEEFLLLGADGSDSSTFSSGEEVRIRLSVRFLEPVNGVVFGISLVSEEGVPVYSDSTNWEGTGTFSTGQRAVFEAGFRLSVPTGSYTVGVGLRRADRPVSLARTPRPRMIYVAGRHTVNGAADLGARFRVADHAGPDEAV